jgi:hypothetical protein
MTTKIFLSQTQSTYQETVDVKHPPIEFHIPFIEAPLRQNNTNVGKTAVHDGVERWASCDVLPNE